MSEPPNSGFATAHMSWKKFSDDEILALHLAATLDTDPTESVGYERAVDLHLITPGPHPFHDIVKQALTYTFNERFQPEIPW